MFGPYRKCHFRKHERQPQHSRTQTRTRAGNLSLSINILFLETNVQQRKKTIYFDYSFFSRIFIIIIFCFGVVVRYFDIFFIEIAFRVIYLIKIFFVLFQKYLFHSHALNYKWLLLLLLLYQKLNAVYKALKIHQYL